jgi:hypothetical protein
MVTKVLAIQRTRDDETPNLLQKNAQPIGWAFRFAKPLRPIEFGS